MNREINKVFASDEYDKFGFFEENRDINVARVKELEESMKEHELEKAIDVNENFKIIDGQHRYTAWRNLGRPIIYVIHKGWGVKEIPVLNTHQKNWNPSDFVRMYTALGIKDYELYEEFTERYGFPHNTNILLLTGGQNSRGKSRSVNAIFSEGKFKVTKWLAGIKHADALKQIGESYEGYKRKNFVAAYLELSKSKNFRHEQLIEKLSYQSRKLVDCTSTEQYYDLLREIYNYKTQLDANRI